MTTKTIGLIHCHKTLTSEPHLKHFSFYIMLFSVGIFLLGCAPDPANRNQVNGTPTGESQDFMPTATIVLQSTPAKADADFSLGNASSVPPADILQEITFYGQGGAGSGSDKRLCPTTFTTPGVLYDVGDGELNVTQNFTTCGWNPGEALKSKLVFPGGRAIDKTGNADECGCYEWRQTPTINDPEGIYDFTVEGVDFVVLSNAWLRLSTVPRLYRINAQELLLFNFSPNEKVRLFLFTGQRPAYFLTGWKEFSVEGDGNLLVTTEITDGYFVAVDSKGYEFPVDDKQLGSQLNPNKDDFRKKQLDLWRRASNTELACPADAKTVLLRDSRGGYPADKHVLARLDGAPIDVYAYPRLTARIVKSFPSGSAIETYGQVSCYDGFIWRRENSGGYFIEASLVGEPIVEVIAK